MRAMKTIVAGVVAGLALAAAVYALFVGAFVIETPTLVARGQLAARLVLVLFICVVALVIAMRVVKKAAMSRARLVASLVALVTAVPFFTLYLYPIWSNAKPDREQQQLRAIAAAVARSDRKELKLPAGYSYAIVRSTNGRAERLTIHASDRAVARVMGIDMSRLDNVAVEIDASGRVTRAWVDYF